MAADETGQDPKLPPDARLGSLEERLERAQRIEAERTESKPADPDFRIGQQVIGHLIGAPIGGAVVGWGLDSLLGTRPWCMLAMLFLGFGIGVKNVVGISKTPPTSGPGSQS